MEPDIATTAQWIGEDAAMAEAAYRAGDYDLLKACLESIQRYAADLGYVPQEAAIETCTACGGDIDIDSDDEWTCLNGLYVCAECDAAALEASNKGQTP